MYTTEQGSFLFNMGNTDGTNNVVMRSDGANVHIYPWGVPYGELKFGASVGYNVSFNGNVTANSITSDGSISGTTGSFSGTVSGANASASANFVPLGQLDSLIPQLFSSVNDVTSSRGFGSTYTNSTGKPMMVCVTGGEINTSQNTTIIQLIINGVSVAVNGVVDSNGGGFSYVTGIVPPNGSYSVNNLNNATIDSWVEIY